MLYSLQCRFWHESRSSAVAIADVEALLTAISPDRKHESGKYWWEGAVELASIDLLGDQPNDVGTAAWSVAAGAIRMISVEPVQDAGSVQKIMDQGVNGDQLQPDLPPCRANVSRANQNIREADGKDFVGNPIDIAQWLYQGIDPI